MAIIVRPMRLDEGRVFLDIHSRSIYGLAARHCTSEIIAGWVVPITEHNIRGLLKNPDDEVRLIAGLNGEPVGLGCLVVPHAELRACYVVPEASRRGVGSAIVTAIEHHAMEYGLSLHYSRVSEFLLGHASPSIWDVDSDG